jgi:hypothetical protein
MCLFTFDAQCFSLTAAQSAPPAGYPPPGGAFCAADKQKNVASIVNQLTFVVTRQISKHSTESKGLTARG